MYQQRQRSVEVRPNTLRDQSAPNTFRTSGPPASARGQRPARGVPRATPVQRLTRPRAPTWVYLVLLGLALFVALYLLSGTP